MSVSLPFMLRELKNNEAFDYNLPPVAIAYYPSVERENSKLFVYQQGQIAEHVFSHLPQLLPSYTTCVINDSKVIPCRIICTKPTGVNIEIFCIEQDMSYPFNQQCVYYKCMIGGAKKWKGDILKKIFVIHQQEGILTIRKEKQKRDFFILQFSWNILTCSFLDILYSIGQVPLPPYIERIEEEIDKQRYQTVYAKNEGSVAAPTAGLHFTPTLIQALSNSHITVASLCLHVGLGTFQPMKSAYIKDHIMHGEKIMVSQVFLQTLLAHVNESIVAVGTTSARALESMYWLANHIHHCPQTTTLLVEQFAPYYDMHQKQLSVKDAWLILLSWMNNHKQTELSFYTHLMIVPTYSWKVVQGLITNFHQPHSTLLCLVASFIGDDWKKLYYFALQRNARFLSYGDACLLWRIP